MNFDLSETQEMFRSTTERFTQNLDVTARTKLRALESGYERTRWTELCELGLLAVAAKESQGGLEGSITDLSVIAETLGNNNAPDPWLENGILPVSLLSKANHESILEELLNGSKIAALAFAEPNMRYELAPRHTVALPSQDGEGYQLSGEKYLVMGGALADYFLVTAVCQDEFSLFCLAADTPGIETFPYRLADGSIGTTLRFSSLHVPATAWVNLSAQQYLQSITEACLLCCSEMFGLSKLAFDETLQYVKERKQFDVPIGSFQSIQHGLVDCYSELEQIRATLLRILLLSDESPERWRAEVMGAKSFISDAANYIAERSVQYHGAMGITDEVVIGHALKRIIMLSRLFGDSSHNLKQYMECA